MQKAAFFDIDGTVFRSSLLIELVEQLIEEGVFEPHARDIYQEPYSDWINREGSYEQYIGAVVESFIENIKGVFYGDLADVGRFVVAEHSKRVYRFTRDFIAKLKAQDYYIVAISQSPKTILDDFCAAYGFDKVYGRIYELGPQDRFTGKVTGESLISDKAKIVSRVFERQPIDKKGSIGVGDTEGDVPLLESVEIPICFNPNKALYDYAQEKGWQIVVERKDVIYEL
jgi:HAD superfamily hydrolase (TIGR01490 family)